MATNKEMFAIIELIKGQAKRKTLPPEMLGYASMEDKEVYETIRQLDRREVSKHFGILLGN